MLGRTTGIGEGIFRFVREGRPPVLCYRDISPVTADQYRSRNREVPIRDPESLHQAIQLKEGDPIRITEVTDWDAPGLPRYLLTISLLESSDFSLQRT